jgi:hypothetical protein
MLKYADVDSFLRAYSGKFDNLDHEEQLRLFNTANWMDVVLRMIPARKNKGLVIQVIPKLVEGWQAKYVTGSGQKKTTADRVHIFETEGNVTAHHRGRMRTKATRHHPSTKKSFKRPISKLSKPAKVATPTTSTVGRRTVAIPAPAKVYSFRVPRVQFQQPVVSQAPPVSSSGVIHFDSAETDGEVSDDDSHLGDDDLLANQPDEEDFAQCLSLIRNFSGCVPNGSSSDDKLCHMFGSDCNNLNGNFDFNFTPIGVTYEESADGIGKPKLTRIFSWGTTATQVLEPNEIDGLLEKQQLQSSASFF